MCPSPRACARSLALAAVLMAAAAPASAEPGAAGTEPLARARVAWERREFARADAEARGALERGGLAREETVEAYVLRGSALTELRRRGAAIDAFRHAAMLDQHFEIPRNASKGVKYVAEAMRKEKAKVGSIALRLETPDLVRAGRPFGVVAAIDDPHVPMVARVRLLVKDSLSGKSYETDAAAAGEVGFEVPTQVTLPGATLLVRVQAEDTHKNRLADAEQRVRVEVATSATPEHRVEKETLRAPEKSKTPSGGGFWSTAWPYVIGTLVLGGAGTGVYLYVRPATAVAIGGAHIETH